MAFFENFENKNANKKLYIPAYANAPLKGNVRKQITFWLCALFLFIAFLYAFSAILPPFVVGMALAYFLNPLIEMMKKIGLSRTWGTVIITIFVIFLFVALLTIFVPIIGMQLQQFITSGLPTSIEKMQNLLSSHNFEWIQEYLGSDPTAVQSNIHSLLSYGSDFLRSILNSILSSGKSIFDFLTFFIVTPVVTFYLLLDWERMVTTIDSWLPRGHLETIRGIFHEMDRAVAGFIRGQGTVCLLLAIYYTTLLTIIGLNYSILIGVFIGGIAFIPYFGSICGFIITLWVAWFQFYPDESWILLFIMGAFFLGQFLEGYVLQPKLVGSSVGLHPVWLMFALFAFGSAFGFTGMLVAVPAAAALGALVRFALYTYLASPVYSDKIGQNENVR